MNKFPKLLLMLALLLAGHSKSFALFTSVNLSTGTAGVGNTDPLWTCSYPGGGYMPCQGVADSDWPASCSGGKWSVLTPNLFTSITLTYRMAFWIPPSTINNGQMIFDKLAADNQILTIRVNGVPYNLNPIPTLSGVTNLTINLQNNNLVSGINIVEVDVHNFGASQSPHTTKAGLLICGKLNYNSTAFTTQASGCNGLSVSFHPDAGIESTNYLWDFGDGTKSNVKDVVHNFAKAGTYTVSLTVTNGSNSSTTTQQVQVGAQSIIGSTMSLCDPLIMTNSTYMVPLTIAGSTYSWTITATFGTFSSNVSYSNANSSGSVINVDWTNVLAQLESQRLNHPHDIPVVQLCVKNNQCGTTTCITLSGCCKAVAPSDGPSNYVSFNVKDAILVPSGTPGSNPLPTSNAGGYNLTGYIGVPANVSNIYLNVIGFMGINTDVVFTNTHFTGNENAVIPIFPGKNVGLVSSVLEGCYYMWKGIENNGKLSIDGTEMLDAKVGVNHQNQAGLLSVNNSFFNNNETDIWVNNSPITSANFSVKNSIFTSRSLYNGSQNSTVLSAIAAGTLGSSLGVSIGSYTSGNLKGSPVMGIAINQVRSSYGFSIQTPSTAITNIGVTGAANRNYFDNKENAGIIASSSNVNVFNNTFENMLSATVDNGAGIVINNSTGTIPTLNIGVAGTNTFTNMNNGVLATGACKFNVLNNNFSYITRKGVRIQKWYASSSAVSASLAKINSNSFAQCMYDVYAYNNTTINAEIASNNSTFTANPKDYSVNVYIDEINRPRTAYYTVSGNIFTGKEFGLYSQNTRNMNVLGNSITIAAPNQVAPSNAAIWLNSSDAGTYTANILTSLSAANAQNQNMAGVRVSTSGVNTFKCNVIKKVGYCMSFSGPCSSNLHKNSFNTGSNTAIIGIFLDRAYTGPLVYNNSGTLYCAENTFGNFSVAHTYTQNSSVGSNIYYPGAANSSNPMYPVTNIAISPSFVYTPVANANQGALSCGSSNPPHLIVPNVSPFMGARYDLDFGDYTAKIYASARKGIYEYIVGEGLTNSDFDGADDFVDMMSKTTTSVFYEVDTKIWTYLDSRDASILNEAIDKNNAIVPENNIDENQKLFNALYMNSLLVDSVVSDSVIGILKTLVGKCPITEGTSIYQARAMLRQYDDNVYTAECEIPIGPEGDSSIDTSSFTSGVKEVKGISSVLVFPNPARTEVNFTNLPDGASIVFYNILGMEMMNKNVTGAEVSIDTRGLERGMYIYKVIKGSDVIKTEKLLLIQ